jgi:hypothetical protein
MKKLALGLLSLSLLTGGGFGVNAALAGNGEGHTPVVVCHWVPAAPAGNHQIAGPDGGSYVVIVVDDDGANGNKNLRAHDPSHHEHDIIGDEDCGVSGEEE